MKLKLPPEPDLLGDALEENRKLRADARRLRKAAIAYLSKTVGAICKDQLPEYRELLAAVKESQRTEES